MMYVLCIVLFTALCTGMDTDGDFELYIVRLLDRKLLLITGRSDLYHFSYRILRKYINLNFTIKEYKIFLVIFLKLIVPPLMFHSVLLCAGSVTVKVN